MVPPTTASVPETATRDSLLAVALRASDLPPGAAFRLIPGGDRVAGQVTLDLCGAVFPSEELRSSRLQQIAFDGAETIVVNDENVRYVSARAAEQALNELRQAIASCDPTAYVGSHVAGVPPLRYDLVPIPEAELEGLSADHVAFVATVTARSGKTITQALVYQRRGAVFTGVYGSDASSVLPYAHLVAERLQALTSTEAGE